MASLTHRSRLLASLNHKVPDRVPIDLGGSYATGINVEAYDNWKAYLGISSPTEVASRRSQIAFVEEELRSRFGIDTLPILPRPPHNPPEQVWPDGSYRDEWGVIRNRAVGGHYYVTHAPLADISDASALARYPWPDPYDPGYVEGLRDETLMARQTDYAVVLSLPVGFLHQAAFMRGTENLLMDMVSERALSEALLDRIVDIHCAIAARILDAVGDLVDIVLYADDLGFNDRTMVSPALYRSLIKPRQRRFLDLVHSKTSAKVLYHTCGAIYPLIGDFIEIGVDVLNPIQVTAAGMEPARLKREYGRDLCFWGGIDVVRLLPFGTPEEVRDGVERMIDTLGPDGYVLGASNNVQVDTAPANLTAMLEASLNHHF